MSNLKKGLSAILIAGVSFFVIYSIVTYNQKQSIFEEVSSSDETNSDIQDKDVSLNKDISDPDENKVSHISTPEELRGIYMTSWVAGNSRLRERLILFIEETSLNTIVIDVKISSGEISFKIDNEYLSSFNSFSRRVRDIDDLISELHEKGIYVVGRVVVFQDSHYASIRPDQAVQNKEGDTWESYNGSTWVDPSSKDMWKYIAVLSEEVYNLGFDEINYDYIRFPTDGNLSDIVYPLSGARLANEQKTDILKDFLSYIDGEVRSKKIPVSVDVFGLVAVAGGDIGIGQILEDIVPYVDYISPMVYPSHFADGWSGYQNPAEYPYEVIYETMNSAKQRLIAIGDDPQKIRPWLQDFSLGYSYGISEVQAQMQGVIDSGLNSWMMWNASNKYTNKAYE